MDNLRVIDRAAARTLVQRVYRIPQATDNKYTRGVVHILTGSQAYPGAAILSCSGAVWAGAGLVHYHDLEQLKFSVIAARPEVVVRTVQSDTQLLPLGDQRKTESSAWVVGCGIDPQQGLTVTQVNQLLGHYTDDSPHSSQFLPPLVLDASGLELLSVRVSPAVVITPHLGEARRLWQRWSDGAAIPEDPVILARELHHMTGASVLLKGNTSYWVDSTEAYSITSPSAWQAQAGTGDVLAGLLGALLAQNADRLAIRPDLSNSGVASTDAASAGPDLAIAVSENSPVNSSASANSNTPVTAATSVNSLPPLTLGEVAMAAMAIFNQTPDVAPHCPLPALQLARTIPATISNLLN